VIHYAHLGLDHRQKLTTSRRSSLAHAYHVWSTSVTAFVSYPAHRQTDRQTERLHNSASLRGVTSNCGRRSATRYAALYACVYYTGVHSCWLNNVLCTDSTAVLRSVTVECTQGIRQDWNTVTQLSQKESIFTAALY